MTGPVRDPMRRALELAALGRGRTAPNPPVGAVVVRAGQIVGEGRHVAAGQPHAETVALAAAGPLARGATLFVSLEPCCHHGRTPPCTDAIVAAGVAEVRYAIEDPDPRVAGGGRRALVEAGVRVALGGSADAEAAQAVLRGYLHRQRVGRPWVTAKYAMSLDGKIATRTGDARWISGETSRRHAHALRDRSDAVIVGIGTVLADDPRLTVRPAPADGHQPHRVVLDSRLRMPLTAALAGPELAAGTTVAFAVPAPSAADSAAADSADATGAAAAAGAAEALVERGLTLLALPSDPAGRVDLGALLEALGRRGYADVLVEGGGEVLAGLFALGLVDEVEACLAPIVVGGRTASTPIGGLGVERIEQAGRLRIVEVVRRDEDVWIVARPSGPRMEVASV